MWYYIFHLVGEKKKQKTTSLFLRLLLGLLGLGLLSSLLDNLLDNLLFLNKESTDNLVLNAVGAERATVSTVDSLLGVANLRVLSWSQSSETGKSNSTFTALRSGWGLLDVKISKLSTRGLNDLDPVRSGVVYINFSKNIS